MERLILFIIGNALSIMSVLFAFLLLSTGKNGWSWFLLIAVLCQTTLSTKDEE